MDLISSDVIPKSIGKPPASSISLAITPLFVLNFWHGAIWSISSDSSEPVGINPTVGFLVTITFFIPKPPNNPTSWVLNDWPFEKISSLYFTSAPIGYTYAPLGNGQSTFIFLSIIVVSSMG